LRPVAGVAAALATWIVYRSLPGVRSGSGGRGYRLGQLVDWVALAQGLGAALAALLLVAVCFGLVLRGGDRRQ
jgi:hypothetical protein